jgi:hypothetical protein
MVRRGSAVRVRQRAVLERLNEAVCAIGHLRVVPDDRTSQAASQASRLAHETIVAVAVGVLYVLGTLLTTAQLRGAGLDPRDAVPLVPVDRFSLAASGLPRATSCSSFARASHLCPRGVGQPGGLGREMILP